MQEAEVSKVGVLHKKEGIFMRMYACIFYSPRVRDMCKEDIYFFSSTVLVYCLFPLFLRAIPYKYLSSPLPQNLIHRWDSMSL